MHFSCSNSCVTSSAGVSGLDIEICFSPAFALALLRSYELPGFGDFFCRTTPSLSAAIICCPMSCACGTGKMTGLKPSLSNTRCQASEDMPGQPGMRNAVSSYFHHPSSRPKVRWANNTLVLISFNRSKPFLIKAAFA